MKFTISFKTPDADLQCPVVMDFCGEHPTLNDLIDKVFTKFTRWGEVVEIEFDTYNMTAEVIQQNQV